MIDFATIATLSAFGWIAMARRSYIGVGLVIGLAFVIGGSHG
ncbi:hypothetical protein [Pseudomonas sp. C9-3]|nr:hypothetical protein [Pseudomonas sp. C9-3]